MSIYTLVLLCVRWAIHSFISLSTILLQHLRPVTVSIHWL